MYKHSYKKRLSKKMSDRARRGWEVRRLRMMAEPRDESFEDMVARAKDDRRGAIYRHLVGCDGSGEESFRFVLRHAPWPGRSDQFDVVEYRRSEWCRDVWLRLPWPEPVAMGAVLSGFSDRI